MVDKYVDTYFRTFVDKKGTKELSKLNEKAKKFGLDTVKSFNNIAGPAKKAAKTMTGIETVSKKLHTSIYSVQQGFKQAGISSKKLGISYSNMDEFQTKANSSVNQLTGSFNSWGKVMAMDKDLFIGATKAGYKFTGGLAPIAQGFRIATHGLHGFKMELLSVMFFGMQMQRIGLSMLGPAMKAYGVGELFSQVLLVVMLPVMEQLFPYLLDFAKWLMDLGPLGKMILGLGAGFLVVGGTILFMGGQLGLFLGSIPQVFGILHHLNVGLGKMAGAFRHPIKAMRAMGGFFKRTLLKMWLTAKTGFRSIGKTTQIQTTLMNGTLKKGGKQAVRTARVTGNGVRKGLLGPFAIVLMVITAAIAIFALAWKNNWGGIRQTTGGFVIWFSGVYDKWIKPVLLHFGTGIIVLKNVIGFVLGNIRNIWSANWLTIKLVAFNIWNTILSGIEFFINGLATPFRVLYGAVSRIAGFLGKDLPPFPTLNLDKYKISTKEVNKELKEVKGRLKAGLKDMAVKTVKDVKWLDETLTGFTGTMKKAGEGMIESGDKMDAERAAKEANGEKTSMLDGITSKFSNLISGTATPSFDNYTDSVDINTSALGDAGNKALSTVPKIEDLDLSVENLDTSFNDLTNDIKTKNIPVNKDQKESFKEVNEKVSGLTLSVNNYVNSLNSIPYTRSTDIFQTVHIKKVYERTFSQPSGGMTCIPGYYYNVFTGRCERRYHSAKGGLFIRPAVTSIAEKGPEAVIPLNKMDNFGGVGGKTININLSPVYNISGVSSPEDVENQIEEANSKLIDDLKSMVR